MSEESTSLSERLQVSFANQSNDEITVHLDGALDCLSAPAMRPYLESLVTGHEPVVTVDLSHLSTIDSSGMAVMVSLYKRLLDQGREVHIRGLHDEPLAIFRLLNLDRVMQVEASS